MRKAPSVLAKLLSLLILLAVAAPVRSGEPLKSVDGELAFEIPGPWEVLPIHDMPGGASELILSCRYYDKDDHGARRKHTFWVTRLKVLARGLFGKLMLHKSQWKRTSPDWEVGKVQRRKMADGETLYYYFIEKEGKRILEVYFKVGHGAYRLQTMHADDERFDAVMRSIERLVGNSSPAVEPKPASAAAGAEAEPAKEPSRWHSSAVSADGRLEFVLPEGWKAFQSPPGSPSRDPGRILATLSARKGKSNCVLLPYPAAQEPEPFLEGQLDVFRQACGKSGGSFRSDGPRPLRLDNDWPAHAISMTCDGGSLMYDNLLVLEAEGPRYLFFCQGASLSEASSLFGGARVLN